MPKAIEAGQNVTITGLEEVLKNLKTLDTKIQKSIMTGAIRAGAKLIADEARRNVPERSQRLKKSIGIRKRRSKKGDKGTIRFVVGPITSRLHDLQDAASMKQHSIRRYNYGNIIEEGSKATSKKRTLKDGSKIEYGTSTIPPNPYMRNAYLNKGEEAIGATKKYLVKRVTKTIAELKK